MTTTAPDDTEPTATAPTTTEPTTTDGPAVDGPTAPTAPPLGWLRSHAAEAAVVVAALVINAWALSQNGYANTYYSATVRSMGDSLHNFVYGSYDPGGWISTDKPPFPYWISTVVTKLFGYSSWTLLLPSAICGAAAVALLIATIRPVWGRAAGITAGIALALTPAMVAVSRSNNPDAMLVLLTVAAAWATTKALRNGQQRWLVAAAAFVGLAFLTKLLAGFVALPGLWLAYLVAGPHSWKRRAGQLLAATAVVTVIAAGWVAFMDLTPATNRPYVGSSADGTARDLVFGYNGFGRIFGQAGPGAQGVPLGPGMIVGNLGIDQFGGQPGPTRLFNNGMGDQIMWLLPAALVAGAAAIAIAARARRRDARVGTAIIYLTWLVLTAAVFSTAKGIFHNYYVSLLAPALAALVGIGVGLLRTAGRVGRLLAAGTLVATAALQLVLLDRVDAWQWLRVVVPAGLIAAAIALVVSTIPPARRRAGAITAVAGTAAVVIALAAPAAWSLSALQRPANGTFPDARPLDAGGLGAATTGFGSNTGGPGNPLGGLPEAELAWLRTQHGTERWLLAVNASLQASESISNGDSIMAMGGFTGSDPAMTKDHLADLVDRGELRFVTAGGFSLGNGNAAATSAVTQVCTPVPANNWDPDAGETPSGIYDCRGKGAAIRTASDAPADGTAAPNVPGPTGGPPGGAGFPGAGGLPPGGIPADVTPEQMQFGMCVGQHGGNLQELIATAQGAAPSDSLQQAIDACGGLPPGAPGGPSAPPPTGDP